MARELNSSYQQIADLRQEADEALARQTETVNSLLSNIESIDAAIRDATQAGVSSSEMEDERDRLLEQLSGYLDLNVSKTDHEHAVYPNQKRSAVVFRWRGSNACISADKQAGSRSAGQRHSRNDSRRCPV
jgi:flagellar hook-associated protein FlgK